MILTDTNVDGSTKNTVDSSSGTTQGSATVYQSLLNSHTGLSADTPHNLHLANGGQGEFDLDFVVVQSIVSTDASTTVTNTTVDDADPAFTFTGSGWNVVKDSDVPAAAGFNPNYNNGSQQVTMSIGDKVQLEFSGTGVVSGFFFHVDPQRET